jgi:hypothetical protein
VSMFGSHDQISTEKPVVYLIPAADMDERVIDGIQIEGVKIHRVKLPILTAASTLREVTDQISSQINHKNPILLGFCSGSMLAIEVAKIIEPQKIIVVSGITNGEEIVQSRKILACAFNALPEWCIQTIGVFVATLVNKVLRLTVKIPRIWLKVGQNKFILRHALSLNSRDVNGKVIRIHGAKDLIVPLAKTKADYVVPDAGHFMFVYQRKEVLQAVSLAIR